MLIVLALFLQAVRLPNNGFWILSLVKCNCGVSKHELLIPQIKKKL